MAKRTTIEKVKEAMFTEVDTDNTINPIFVYATDEALEEQPLHLSSALQVRPAIQKVRVKSRRPG